MHPGGAEVRQQRQRLVDQVVVIEQAAPRLLAVIACQHLMRDGGERNAAVAAGNSAAAFEQRVDAPLFGGKALNQRGVVNSAGDDRCASRASAAFGGAEDIEVSLDALRTGQ